MSLVQFPANYPSQPGGVEVDKVRTVIDLMPAYIDLAGRIANTEFVPTGLRRRPEAVLAALMSGAERGLGPMEALRSVHIIEGRPTLSAEMMRALVYAAGHTIEIVETTAQRATVIGRRAGSESTSPPFTWTLDRARRARLANKNVWQQYPEQMLLARATAELCRAVFPDVIAGLMATEEVDDIAEAEPATVRKAPPKPRRRQVAATAAAHSGTQAPAAVAAPTQAAGSAPTAAQGERTDLGGIPGAERPSWAAQAAPEPASEPDPNLARRLHAQLAEATPDASTAERDRWRHALVAAVTRRRPDGPVTSSNDLSLDEQLDASKFLANMTAGRASIADGPDDRIELRAGAGWIYEVDLSGPTVTSRRGAAGLGTARHGVAGQGAEPDSAAASENSENSETREEPAEATPTTDQPTRAEDGLPAEPEFDVDDQADDESGAP